MEGIEDDHQSLNSRPTARRHTRLVSGMACVAILPLVGFISLQIPSLLGEFSSLKLDQRKATTSAPVGYLGINPAPQLCRPAGELVPP